MIFLAVIIASWFLWDRFVKSVSERAKFFVAVASLIVCVPLVMSFSGYPSIGVGLMFLVVGPVVIKRGLDWYRSVQVH